MRIICTVTFLCMKMCDFLNIQNVICTSVQGICMMDAVFDICYQTVDVYVKENHEYIR